MLIGLIMTPHEYLKTYLPPAADWKDAEFVLTTKDLIKQIEDNTSESIKKIDLIDTLRNLDYQFEMQDGIMHWLIAKSLES